MKESNAFAVCQLDTKLFWSCYTVESWPLVRKWKKAMFLQSVSWTQRLSIRLHNRTMVLERQRNTLSFQFGSMQSTVSNVFLPALLFVSNYLLVAIRIATFCLLFFALHFCDWVWHKSVGTCEVHNWVLKVLFTNSSNLTKGDALLLFILQLVNALDADGWLGSKHQLTNYWMLRKFSLWILKSLWISKSRSRHIFQEIWIPAHHMHLCRTHSRQTTAVDHSHPSTGHRLKKKKDLNPKYPDSWSAIT